MDDEFEREVLRLAEGQTAQVYEEDLKAQAQNLGIDLTHFYQNTDKETEPTPCLSTSTQPRRSISTCSGASHSTGITEASQISKDQLHSHVRLSRGRRRSSATSLSIKDYDSIVSHAKYDHRRSSFNFSPSSVPSSPSIFSLPAAWARSRESSPRRQLIRGLSRLRIKRTDSKSSIKERNECPHCPQSGSRHRGTLHALPCGHRYCTLALQKKIKDSLNEGTVPPTCCKTPIPGTLVARIMSQEEQDVVMNVLVAWDDEAIAASTKSTTPGSESGDAFGSRPRSSPAHRGATSPVIMMERTRNLERAMQLPHFKELRLCQERQRDDLIALADRRRQNMMNRCAIRKLELLPTFDRQKDELAEKQSETIARIEDKHVVDEHEMRKVHEVEARNNAVALKHMEAYCRGETTSGGHHTRKITDRDVCELTKARRTRDQMNARHDSAISVLRGDQSRRMRQRLQKQEEELAELEKNQKKELDGIQQKCDELVQDWDKEIEEKKNKLQILWDIQIEIWRKMLEKENDIHFVGVFPQIPWTDKEEWKDSSTKRYTIASPSLHDIKLGGRGFSNTSHPSPKEHQISTAFTIRGGMIGQTH